MEAAMNEKISITLPSELVEIIQEQVDSGRYDSISDVVRDVLERQDWYHAAQADIDQIRQKIAEALNDPRPSISAEELRTRLKQHLNELYGR
jgi:antitoxin ParD1/3/4